MDFNYSIMNSSTCQVEEPLGIEDGRISDDQITASSVFTSSHANHGASNARLNRPAQSGTTGAWSALSRDANQWIQTNLGHSMVVTGVKIQGRSEGGQWVTQFKVQYSNDGNSWTFVQQTNNQGDMIFEGNTDHTTVVTNCFPTQVTAAYIRIVPTAWNIWISLRFELLGCEGTYIMFILLWLFSVYTDGNLLLLSGGFTLVPWQSSPLSDSSNCVAILYDPSLGLFRAL
ncbi:lactadherin-like [Amphiura filiformis]|uniref:lactadherin-like n=1 Tax=Amphiura filiformis TaxID=82378 RepID=UPI003B213BE7